MLQSIFLLLTIFSFNTFGFQQLEFKSSDHFYKIKTQGKKFEFAATDLFFSFSLSEKSLCIDNLKQMNNILIQEIVFPVLKNKNNQNDNANSFFRIDGEVKLFNLTSINKVKVQRIFNEYYKKIFKLKRACQ